MELSVVKQERVGQVEVEDIRKDLLSDFNALPQQEAPSENLQVFLRIRPLTSTENDSGEQDCVSLCGSDTVILKAPRTNKSFPQTGQRFSFSQVFGPDSSQRSVFDASVRPRVREVLDGGNCLVFTYGVTNAGKTFTFLGPDHDSGLLPRSLAMIFSSLEGRLYSGCDLKPLRCRDFTRLSPEQQNQESNSKRTLLRLFKETDKSLTSGKSTFLDGSVSDSSLGSEPDSFVLDVGVKFSVWVSFCEIYNDAIHDLLEPVPPGQRRTGLRLSQDVKGNSFIKGLRWVQVSSSDEAHRIMKIGKKNQSVSATRLNLQSSRSHSIFSVRLMKIDDVGVPRVQAISELALCDLAGSERCSRTQNTGERLKEAGNINSSLLTLGKCLSAMRTKFQQHVPFRESKLTHFLQFFLCGSGSGKVTMVVNINQSFSSLDETLNVLKFSALAQKVVVLNARAAASDPAPHRSAMELSLIIDEAESRRFRSRKSSMVWERRLEDVLETQDSAEEEEEEEMEETVLEATNTTVEPECASALKLVLEAQIREEVSTEFMELFNKMEKDYSERLEKEREILEERAEKRVEILKNLVHRTLDLSALERQDPEGVVLNIISAQDLEKIREEQENAKEVQCVRLQRQETLEQLQAARQVSELAELCRQKDDIINKLTCTLDQTVEDVTRERSVVESVRGDLMQLQQNCSCLRRREEARERGEEARGEEAREQGEEARGRGDKPKERGDEARKRPRGSGDDELAPAKRRVLLEEEIWRLHEENDQKELLIFDLNRTITGLEEEQSRLNRTITGLEGDLQHKEEELRRMRKEQELSAVCRCDSLLGSLESEQRETSRLDKENKALTKGMFQLQNQVDDLKKQLRSQSERAVSQSEELTCTKARLHSQSEELACTKAHLHSQSEELTCTKARLHSLQSQLEEREHAMHQLQGEMDKLRRESEEDVFHEAMNHLKQESETALRKSAEKTQQIQELQEKLQHSELRRVELTEESTNQRAAFERLEAELQERCVSLERRLETTEQERERTNQRNQDLASLGEQTVAEAQAQMETLRKELERLREQLQDPQEESQTQHQVSEKVQDEVQEEAQEERKVTVVEELKEELQKLQQRRNNRVRQQEENLREENLREENLREENLREQNLREQNLREQNLREQRKMEAVKREVQRFRELQNHHSRVQKTSPEKLERRRTPRTTGTKRKSCEVQGLVFSENKRNRGRAALSQQASSSSLRPLNKLGDLLHKSPSVLSSTAKGLVGLMVDGRSSKLKRGRRKLYGTNSSSPMIDSPDMAGGGSLEEKESNHFTIKRQLRSKRK